MDKVQIKLECGEIQINQWKYPYDSLEITSELYENNLFEKTQEIILDLHNPMISPESLADIRRQQDNMETIPVIFQIMEHNFRHFAILESYTQAMIQYPPFMETDMRFCISLAEVHVNKGLHKLIKELE